MLFIKAYRCTICCRTDWKQMCYVFVYFLTQGMGSCATTPPAGILRHGLRRHIGFVRMETVEAVQDSYLQILMLHFSCVWSWHKWELSGCGFVAKRAQERIPVVSGPGLNIPPSVGTEEAEDVHRRAPLPAQAAACRKPPTRSVEGRKDKLHGGEHFKITLVYDGSFRLELGINTTALFSSLESSLFVLSISLLPSGCVARSAKSGRRCTPSPGWAASPPGRARRPAASPTTLLSAG